jgi:ankyrin repeat protein
MVIQQHLDMSELGRVFMLSCNLSWGIFRNVLALSLSVLITAHSASAEDKGMSLIRAAGEGDLKMVEQLIGEGVDVNSRTSTGATPLLATCLYGVSSYMVLRTSSGKLHKFKIQGQSSSSDGTTDPKSRIAGLLLKKGAILDAKTEKGMTPLAAACLSGQPALVKLLIDRGADVNSKDNQGSTPLMHCLKGPILSPNELAMSTSFGPSGIKMRQVPIPYEEDRGELLKLLLEKGADVNVKNNDGSTALLIACSQGRTSFVKILLGRQEGGFIGTLKRLLFLNPKLDVNAKDNQGKTPLAYAKERGNKKMVSILKAAGAKE